MPNHLLFNGNNKAKKFHCPYDPIKLIKLMECRPELWDKSDTNYKNRFKKQNSWGEIIRQLEEKFDEMDEGTKNELEKVITTRWVHLRDAFYRAVQKQNKQYKYHSDMSFLLKNLYAYHGLQYLENSDPIGSFSDNEVASNSALSIGNADDDTTKVEVDSLDKNDDQQIDDNTHDSWTPRPKKKRSKKRKRFIETITESEDIESEQNDGIPHEVESISLINTNDQDEDEAFFISILPTVRSMEEDDKFDFRIEILKYLQNIKRKYKARNE